MLSGTEKQRLLDETGLTALDLARVERAGFKIVPNQVPPLVANVDAADVERMVQHWQTAARENRLVFGCPSEAH